MQQPAQGFLPPSSHSPDLEAMRSAHSAAINANEKIFPIFARKLASGDPNGFLNTTCKLAAWLGSEKAYYPAARPKIVELLEIALTSFRKHPSNTTPEFAGQLRKLMEAVVPFIHLFPEAELKARLQRAVLAAEHALSGAASATATVPSPPLPLPVHPQPSMPPIPVPPESTAQVQPPVSAPDVVPVDIPQTPNLAEIPSDQPDTTPSLASVTHVPSDVDEKYALSAALKPQPKRARRAELSEALVARDLDWFKTNRVLGGGAGSDQDMPTIKTESSPVLASDVIHGSGRSPPRKKTARIVPHRRLPRRITLDVAQEATAASALLVLSELKAEDISIESPADVTIPNVTEQRLSLDRTEPDIPSTAILEAHDMQDVLQSEVLPPEPPPTSDLPFIKSEIPPTDDRCHLVDAPLVSGESAAPSRQSVPPPETTTNGVESMDISPPGSLSGSRSLEPTCQPESTPPQSLVTFSLRSPILPPPVTSWEPPLDLNFRIPAFQLDANARRFDDKMIVMYGKQGKPFNHTHMIDISLNESVFSKLLKWVNRKSDPSEAPRGVCMVLACYRLPELFDMVQSAEGTPDLQELTLRSTCSWPPSSRLSLHVDNGTRRTVVTLSPPLFVTPDQCVDISSLMKLGENTLEIRQLGDLSEYLFVLHAHHPTGAQLAELDAIKAADVRWRRFLDVISGRAVPGNVTVLGGASAGVVGAF